VPCTLGCLNWIRLARVVKSRSEGVGGGGGYVVKEDSPEIDELMPVVPRIVVKCLNV